MSSTINLSKMEQAELNQRAIGQTERADEARHARLILLLDAGHAWAAIREKLDCTDSFIDRWSKRFRAERLAGLFSRHAGQRPTTLTAALEARILEWTVKRKPPDGATHWSTRKLGEALGISHMMVAGRGPGAKAKDAVTQRPRKHVSMTWAQRLKRVFAIDIERCCRCGGRLRVIASIEEPALIARILAHLRQGADGAARSLAVRLAGAAAARALLKSAPPVARLTLSSREMASLHLAI